MSGSVIQPPPRPVHADRRVHALLQDLNRREGEAHAHWAKHAGGRHSEEVARQVRLMLRAARAPKTYGMKRWGTRNLLRIWSPPVATRPMRN